MLACRSALCKLVHEFASCRTCPDIFCAKLVLLETPSLSCYRLCATRRALRQLTAESPLQHTWDSSFT